MAGVGVVCHRRAQHEVRLPGRVFQPHVHQQLRRRNHPDPDEQRRDQSAHPGRDVPGRSQHAEQRDAGRFLRAGSMDQRPIDAAGGIRFDNAYTSYPDHRAGGPGYNLMPAEILYPAGSTPGIAWHDVTPRVGVAYDLFGNGKTAVKFNLGKYMEGLSSLGGFAVQLSPLNRLDHPDDTGVDRLEQELRGGLQPREPREKRRMRADGRSELRERGVHPEPGSQLCTPAGGPAPTTGRSGVSVQHELLPRVSVTVGFYRNWWGNQSVVDNTVDQCCGLHAVQHLRTTRCPAARRRGPDDQRFVQPRS